MSYKTKSLLAFWICAMSGVIFFLQSSLLLSLLMLIWFPISFVKHQKVNASMIEIGVFITAVVTMLGLDFLDKVVDIGLAGMIFGELLIGILLAGVLYLTLPKKVLKYWE